jgi:hypothetical protein
LVVDIAAAFPRQVRNDAGKGVRGKHPWRKLLPRENKSS